MSNKREDLDDLREQMRGNLTNQMLRDGCRSAPYSAAAPLLQKLLKASRLEWSRSVVILAYQGTEVVAYSATSEIGTRYAVVRVRIHRADGSSTVSD